MRFLLICCVPLNLLALQMNDAWVAHLADGLGRLGKRNLGRAWSYKRLGRQACVTEFEVEQDRVATSGNRAAFVAEEAERRQVKQLLPQKAIKKG